MLYTQKILTMLWKTYVRGDVNKSGLHQFTALILLPHGTRLFSIIDEKDRYITQAIPGFFF